MSWHDEGILSRYDDEMVASYGCLLRISERFVALDGCKLWVSSEDVRDGYGLLHDFDYGLVVVGWKELWTHSFGAVVAFLYSWEMGAYELS